jgi:short-subunit dehydrogenase
VGLTEALRMELVGEGIHVSLVMPGVVDTPLATAAQQDANLGVDWPEKLNMPPSWVVGCIFLAIRSSYRDRCARRALLEKPP